jgi:hypothetical protein
MAHRTGINGPSVALVFSASPFNGPVEIWRLTRLLTGEDRILLAALWQNVPVIICPHCGQEGGRPQSRAFRFNLNGPIDLPALPTRVSSG